MRLLSLLAGAAASIVFAQPALAQATMMVPVGGTAPAPVAQHPVDPKDSAEEIAKDAARDLRDDRFYNKPGATRAQYDSDWQECRLIARGSRTPAGTIPYYYNPAVVSPVAAGVGGALGGLIGGMIAEGEQRRTNRRNCLLIRGWRQVEVPNETAQRVRAMSDSERSNYFNTIVGAQDVAGEITERTSFSMSPAALGKVDGPLSGPESVFLGKKVAATEPVRLENNEGAVVLGFRRPNELSAGRAAAISIARYDPEYQDLEYRPKDWKATGDKTTYGSQVVSNDRKAGLEVQVVKLTAGDYVLSGQALGKIILSTNCFGAPTFHVGAGEVLYLGDFIPVSGAIGADGKKVYGIGYTNMIEDSRRVLASSQPALASVLKAAEIRNGATYACSAVTMDRWDIAGAPALQAPTAAADQPATSTP
jgi:hypothetical protein